MAFNIIIFFQTNGFQFDIIILLFIISSSFLKAQAQMQGDLIFPLQEQHAHGSFIVALPNGDLLTCWCQGSGEINANDVVIEG